MYLYGAYSIHFISIYQKLLSKESSGIHGFKLQTEGTSWYLKKKDKKKKKKIDSGNSVSSEVGKYSVKMTWTGYLRLFFCWIKTWFI